MYLIELKEKYFPTNSHKTEAMRLIPFIIEDNLSYKKLTPYELQKIFIPIFINLLELIVIEKTNIKDLKLLKGFSLFLLRRPFDELLLNF